MTAAQAESGDDKDYVPIIDLTPLHEGSIEGKRTVAEQIRRACEKVGFMVIINHGVPQEVIDCAWSAIRAFFDLPVETKKSVPLTADYPYGYSGIGEEILAKGKDFEQGRQTVLHPDLKESFSIGPYNPESAQPPVRWPQEPKEFEPALSTYYREMEKLSSKLLRVFALALDLPEDFFTDKTDKHCSALRVLNYPALTHPPEEGQHRASPHTDYGVVTILAQGYNTGGLQVLKRSGEWFDVPEVPGAYIINLGDLMQRWTNDKWVSTSHRVICPPPHKYKDSRRLSMAYFSNLNADQVVQCIGTCVSEDNPPKYPPINALDFLMQKHAASVGRYK